MNELRLLARYATIALAVAGGLEWLLGRTISRLAASPALEGTPRAIVEGAGKIGLFLVSPSFVLAFALLLVALLIIGAEAVRAGTRPLVALVTYLALVLIVVGGHTALPTAEWLTISFNMLMLAALTAICARFVTDSTQTGSMRAGIGLSGLAYACWYVYVLQQLLQTTGTGQSPVLWILAVGELAVVAAAVLFFAAVAKGEAWRKGWRWVLPVVVALVFVGGNVSDAVFNQGFVAVFTTWSVGLNLAWPWPLYAVALALFLYSVLTCLSRGAQSNRYANPDTGIGLLFLLYGGYNLQIPYQHMLASLGLLLLTGMFKPFGAVEYRQYAASETVGAERERGVGVSGAGH